jgi:tRNA threonylcarbamoyladenosine biosynthesis protein TsaB
VLLLAVETATAQASVALLRDAVLLAEVQCDAERPTAETLLPAIDALLVRTRCALAEVDAFAVSIGPGSFTSLRIGLATLKGLAFGTPRPALAVSTLQALARSAAPGEGPVVPLLDARRDEFYAAGYFGEALAPWPGLPEGVYTRAELAARLPRACRLTGEGVALCGDALRAALGAGVVCTPVAAGRPRAAHVGALAAPRLQAGDGVDPAGLVPRYVRRAQAEVVRTGERFEARGPA